ncbi:MAG TPA: hypothetical protein DIW30_08230 [Bacteroidales bacterium]|nr:hypothetical protein [Bacteroidales bacterium]
MRNREQESPLETTLRQMFAREMTSRGRAFVHYNALRSVEKKSCECDGLDAEIRFNPERVRSVMAEVDTESLRKRVCFLCPTGIEENQLTTDWQSPLHSGEEGHYCIRVNPFPIFEEHYTLSAARHERQAILPHIDDMFALCKEMPHHTIFYNGPHCGASAPDHFHFQAIPLNTLPLQRMCDRREGTELLRTEGETRTYKVRKYAKSAYLVTGKSRTEVKEQFLKIYQSLPAPNDDEWEPRMNLVAWYGTTNEEYNLLIILRRESRPECFFRKGEEQILISPACVEMSGIAIVADAESYKRLTGERLKHIIEEVSLPTEQTDNMIRNEQRTLHVGVVSNREIRFRLEGEYLLQENGKGYKGEQTATLEDNQIRFDDGLYENLSFMEQGEGASFLLHDVTIGIHFHWERKEEQRFAGGLQIIREGNTLTAVNIIGTEDYLQSVISSEMSADSHIELLKAHAVISRSWVLRPLLNPPAASSSCGEDSPTRHIRWYERDAHTHFDVCADDHCQRYQGITRQTSRAVEEAVLATWGEVLTYDEKICDARFYKSCGGATERFEHCWAEEKHPYLRPIRDARTNILPDLTQEEEAGKWILSFPEAFCNTKDKTILSQVLNNYDQETQDFYRWQVHYTQEEISELIHERSGIDFGTIEDLRPVKRGESGRIYELEIVGSKRRMTIGKELEIRKWLSSSHLYSSAFIVKKETDAEGKTQGFTLHGAGWGHGVGLCQIGAAVMATQGYDYRQILAHYFPGATLKKI